MFLRSARGVAPDEIPWRAPRRRLQGHHRRRSTPHPPTFKDYQPLSLSLNAMIVDIDALKLSKVVWNHDRSCFPDVEHHLVKLCRSRGQRRTVAPHDADGA